MDEVCIEREGKAMVSLSDLDPAMEKALIVPFTTFEEFSQGLDMLREELTSFKRLFDGYVKVSGQRREKASDERAILRLDVMREELTSFKRLFDGYVKVSGQRREKASDERAMLRLYLIVTGVISSVAWVALILCELR